MGYGKETRPDAMGRISYSQQNMDKDACVEHLVEANKALAVLHDSEAVKVLTYAPLRQDRLKLVAIADGALRKKSEKYSQGCFYILIIEVLEGDVGGRCWVVEFRSKRATRVSNSSMSAEILILVRASEALQRISAWLYEIFNGVECARDLLDLPNVFPTQLVSDAFDVFQTLQCSRPYQGADESLSTYLECLREDLLHGRLEEFVWVPTDSMLADGGSKVMDDVLAAALLRNGGWWPSEYKILFRANMDGADSIDKRKEGLDYEEEWEAPIGDSLSWYYGCTQVAWVAQGCSGTCPLCTGSHYECEEDKTPLTYWYT